MNLYGRAVGVYSTGAFTGVAGREGVEDISDIGRERAEETCKQCEVSKPNK